MKIAIICCLHGNEKYGLEVTKKLPSHFSFFIGNKKATIENKRFIDADLNRCFPGDPNGNYEEKLAFELKNKLQKFDYIIDLHSSSNYCPLFGIITKPNKQKIVLARRLGLKRLVIMPEYFAKGNSLIDYVCCGISLEIGPHKRKKNILKVKQAINNLLESRPINNELQIFEAFDIVKQEYNDILINNFDNVKTNKILTKENNKIQKANFDFTAVLVGEEAYKEKNILCLACKQVNLKDIKC